MDNVIIKFEEQGLDNIIDSLVKLGTVDAKQAEEFKASNAAFKQKQDLITASVTAQTKLTSETAKATKSMDDLAKASANAAKNIASGATNEAIKQTGALIDKATDATKKYDASLAGLNKQWKDLVAEAIKAGTNTPFGEKYLKEAAAVKLEIIRIKEEIGGMAKDTAVFNAIGEGLRGIGAGFQIAQGSQALFGTGNKALEEQLVKIQGTMALVNGLTEIQNVLKKESALRTQISIGLDYIENALGIKKVEVKTAEAVIAEKEKAAAQISIATRIKGIATKLVENGLESESVIVRGAATAAQWLLNAAMYAFPLIAIAAGLVAVIGFLGSFSDGTAEATQAQINLTKAELDELEVLKATEDYLNSISKARQEQIQRDIDLLKVKNASTDEIRKKEADLAAEQLRNAKQNFDLHYNEIQALKLNQKEIVGLTAKLAGLNKAKQEQDSKEFDKDIEATTSKLELMTKQVANAEGALKNLKDVNAKSQEVGIQQQKEINKERLNDEKAHIDAQLKTVSAGSSEELKLKKELAANEKELAIKNQQNENDSKEEINAAYFAKIRDLDIAYANKQRQGQIDLNNAKLQTVRQGSQEEFELKKANLKLQNEIEENDINKSAPKKKELHEIYLKAVRDLTIAHNKQMTDDELHTQQSVNSAKLAAVTKGGLEEVELKKEQLLIQQQMELNNIDKNIRGTELGKAKELDIHTKYLAAVDALEEAENVKRIERAAAEQNRQLDMESKLLALEENNVLTHEIRKNQIRLEQFDIKARQLKVNYDKEYSIIASGNKSQEEKTKEFNDLKTKYDDEYRLNKVAKDNEVAKQESEIMKKMAQEVAQYANQTLDILNKANDAYLASQLDGYTRDQAANQSNYDNKVIGQREYEKRKKEIDDKSKAEKTKAAQRAKDIALAQIVINTASAVVNAAAQEDYYAAVAIGLLGAAEYAIASSQPIPQYYKGTENAPKGWAWVGEKGPELMQMKGGEKVRTHEKSMEMARDSFPSPANSIYSAIDRMPVPSESSKQAMATLTKMGIQFDGHLFAQMVADGVGAHIANMPITHFTFDKNGFQASIHEGNSSTKFYNDRYSSN